MSLVGFSIPIRQVEFSANTLLDCVDQELEYPNSLVCPGSRIYTSTETLIFPKPEVHVNNFDQIVNIALPTLIDDLSATSIASQEFRRTYNDMRKLNHDFTFAIFSDSTDQPMRSFFKIQNDGNDNVTPDIIMKIGNRMYVFEFATSRNESAISRVFETKRFTYESALKTRLLNRENPGEDLYCFFGILVVAGDRVCTNMRIPIALVNELCARFRCAQSIMLMAEKDGARFGEDNLSQLEISIKSQLSSLQYDLNPDDCGVRGFTKDIVEPKDSKNDVASKAASYYIYCVKESMKTISNDTPILQDPSLDDDYLNKWLTKMSHGRRQDLKSVVKIPFVSLSQRYELPSPASSDSIYATLWNLVITTYCMNGDSFLISTDEDISRVEDIALSDYDPEEEARLKNDRKCYHRIRLDYDIDVETELAKVGVEGKHHKTNEIIKEYRDSKKTSLALNVDTQDIDSFILDKVVFSEVSQSLDHETTISLIRLALEPYENYPRHGLNALTWITKTQIFQWCDMVSDIGLELAISIKQHCRRKEFVFKQLKNYPVWMLIKPTNTESHIFVSFMFGEDSVDLESEGSCFKDLMDMGTYKCTEFVSFDESKITNLVKAAPFLITQIAQWSRYYEILYDKPELDHNAWSMIKLSLLVHLDDKHSTEEAMTLMRYVCMERFSSLPKLSNYKMIEKIPDQIRSRLQAWASLKLLNEMKKGRYKATIRVDEAGARRIEKLVWENLENPYLGHRLNDPRLLIELFYIGYAKNKDEKSNPNQDFSLVRKILKYEEELLKTNHELFGKADIWIDYPAFHKASESLGSAPNIIRNSDETIPLEFHEWSRSCVLHAADTFINQLEQTMGINWQDALEAKILHNLSRITWEEIATLKASSIFDPQDKSWKAEPGKIHTRREKVIVRIIKELDNLGETPMTTLPKALAILEESGGLLVDIFKKNQHGGLREIYVLDLYSRLIQKALEEISKVLCKEMPSEVMVHPQNKIRRPQAHMIKVAKTSYKCKKNISSSNDASVWNQGHHVIKFTQFLCRILPKWIRPFIQRSMKLWMTRRIKLPDGIINFLKNQSETPMHDPINQTLIDAYTGKRMKPWMKPGDNYITIESGMMQGILHYTSSAFHAAVLLSRDNMFKTMIGKRNLKVQTCDMVSSDDSSRIADILANDPKELRIAELYTMADQVAIKEFSKLFGIRLSPKSTIATNWIMEFNSEWLSKVNLIRPVHKWSMASLGMTEDESIYERQEVWSNQITELLEGGAGFRQCHLTQIGQAVLHYKLLGSSVNPLYHKFTFFLRRVPDPSLGFFVLDHPLAAGLCGLSFSHWVLLNHSREVNKRAAYFFRSGEMTTTTKGIVTRGCVIRFGERKRAQRLLSECEEVLPNWRSLIDEDPSVLYMAPRDKYSSKLKILTKLTSPSVMSSLSKNAALTRIIASSVYIVSKHAMTLTSAWLQAIGGDESYKLRRKTSLLREVTREVPEASLSQEEKDLLFPANKEYASLLSKLTQCSNSTLIVGGSRKSLRSHIAITTSTAEVPFTLEQIIKWKWFGEKLPCATRILNHIWEHYQKIIPWLKDTATSTLENCQAFESHIQLRNFIARQGPRSRTVHLTGSPIRDSSHQDMILSAIKNNQFPGHILSFSSEAISLVGLRGTDRVAHLLESLHTFPLKNDKKTIIAHKILKNADQMWSENMKLVDNRQTRLAILQYFCSLSGMKKEPGKLYTLFSMINDSRLGVVGGFTVRQHRDEDGKWVGEGVWKGKIGDVVVHLYMENGSLLRVETNSVLKLKEVQSLLNKFIKDAELTVARREGFYDRFRYDGSNISPAGQGVPVAEVEEIIFTHPNSMWLDFSYWNGSFRIVGREKRGGIPFGPRITLLSYNPRSTDYKPSCCEGLRNQGAMLLAWSRNEPVSLQQSQLILESGQLNVSGLDQTAYDDFIRVTFLSALTNNGWVLDRCIDFGTAEDAEELERQMAAMYDDIEAFDDIGFDEEDFGEDTEEIEPVYEQVDPMWLDLDWQDLENGSLDISHHYNRDIDIRRGHRIWNKYVTDLNARISIKERRRLCKRQYTKNTEDIAKVLTKLLGWEMTLIEQEPLRQEEPNQEEELLPPSSSGYVVGLDLEEDPWFVLTEEGQ